MKILFVSTNVPVPPNNGQAIRCLSILQGLASYGHAITFISFSNRKIDEELPLLSSCCGKVIILQKELTNLSLTSDYLARVLCMLSFKPYSVQRFRSEKMEKRIGEELNKKFDLVLCDGMYALVNIPSTNIPILLNCHNIEHVLYRRYSRVEKNLAKKCYARIESHFMYRAEFQSMERVTSAMTCSDMDRGMLKEMCPRLRVWVVPNAVDTDVLIPDKAAIPDDWDKPVLLFQGGMDWYPNRDAVEFFVQTVLPRIRIEFPTAKFIVAGRNPPPDFVASFSKDGNIEFTGTVPDMLPYLYRATVVVVPLRIGGGTRIKILEACATGKPVVSTTIGAEGLELTPGNQIILADEPEAFAQTIIDLLKDRARREELGRSARVVVVEKYSQKGVGKRLQDAITDLCVLDT
jgi:glycosyltransferase involved in cell wall biosynthesis